MQRGEPDGAHGWLLRRPLLRLRPARPGRELAGKPRVAAPTAAPTVAVAPRGRLGAGLRAGGARPRGLVVCLRLLAGRPGATRRLRDARVGVVGVTSAARTAVGQEASARRWIRKLAGPCGALRNCARSSRRGVLGTELAKLRDTLVTGSDQVGGLQGFWSLGGGCVSMIHPGFPGVSGIDRPATWRAGRRTTRLRSAGAETAALICDGGVCAFSWLSGLGWLVASRRHVLGGGLGGDQSLLGLCPGLVVDGCELRCARYRHPPEGCVDDYWGPPLQRVRDQGFQLHRVISSDADCAERLRKRDEVRVVQVGPVGAAEGFVEVAGDVAVGVVPENDSSRHPGRTGQPWKARRR